MVTSLLRRFASWVVPAGGRRRPCWSLIVAAVLLPGALRAAEPPIERLWAGEAPLAVGDSAADIPTMQLYLPPDVDGKPVTSAAVLVCPGGGYGGLAMGHEGHEIATWYNELGVAAFVLNYRHRGKGYGHPAPLLDAQRALRMIRARAASWKLDPERIGVMGFSAGGHLASTLATHFDAGRADHQDPIEQASCRPDFAILCYPVIALDEPFAHRGSQRNLLGDNPDPALLKSLSNEKQVASNCPPTFLFHTNEDEVVPAENSLVFYAALRRAGVPAELHVFQHGRHGVGLARNLPGTSGWTTDCIAWLRSLNVVADSALIPR